MNIYKIILKWILFIGFVVAIYFGWPWVSGFVNAVFPKPQMSVYQLLFFALALAFCWTDVLKWGSVKPFTCTKCMTGWFALILCLMFQDPKMWFLFLPAGVFVGAMFEAIKMRWL